MALTIQPAGFASIWSRAPVKALLGSAFFPVSINQKFNTGDYE
jgi:hypothetical protein